MNLFTSRKLQMFHFSFLVVLLLLSVSRNESIISRTKTIRCMEKEGQALVTFKEGLDDEFGLLSSWLTTDDCCEWRGVRCSNRTNRVVGLQLPFVVNHPFFDVKSLGGTLRPSLLELEYLTYLDLSFFNGSTIIPEFVGSLTRLKHLNLSYGTFSGEIPNEIGNLSNLQYLDLSNHYFFATSLSWLSHLSSLRYLDLSNIDLSKAYDWTQAINRLPFLTDLKLSSCGLPGITSTIIPFFNASKSLSILDLSYNSFRIELSRFQWLLNRSSSTLTSVNLSNNGLFGGIFDDFGRMQSLEYLDMRFNMLGPEITKSMGNLSSLRFVDLTYNQLRGTFPASLLKLPRLETLSMFANQIGGQLPMFFPSSPLIKLDLKFNKLSGSLPPSMGNLTELKYLDLSSNGFTGLVTEVHLSNLSKLDTLSLSHNSLILEFNSEDWVPPFNLTQLSLVDCKMGPRFPMWLRSQTNLEVIEVSGCGIDDVIPNWFGHNFHRLSSLNLSNNQIHGTLPHLSTKLFGDFKLDLSSNKFRGPIISVCNVTRDLSYLDLSDNLLSGTIPNCLVQFRDLGFLRLGNNNFSGKIPSLIGQLTHLRLLNLRNNSLNGELPASLQQCKELLSIDIGNNKISGEIPRHLGNNFDLLIVLNLRSNQFKGEIPSNICNLRWLRVLDLSYNRISGAIPKCFGNFTSMATKDEETRSLYVGTSNMLYPLDPTMLSWKGLELEFAYNLKFVKAIDLSSNRLSGVIPSEITLLKELVFLNISRNNLRGKIPLEIGQLYHLEFLDLSRNQLEGTIPLSLSQLTFIGFLDLSSNNLSGRIPSSTQLQGFNASSYSGNAGLCGLPLLNLCPEDQRNSSIPRDPQGEEEEERFASSSFIAALGIGFAVGLLGTLGCLLVNKTWRVAYFRLVSKIQDSLYVAIVVQIAKFKRLWNK